MGGFPEALPSGWGVADKRACQRRGWSKWGLEEASSWCHWALGWESRALGSVLVLALPLTHPGALGWFSSLGQSSPSVP